MGRMWSRRSRSWCTKHAQRYDHGSDRCQPRHALARAQKNLTDATMTHTPVNDQREAKYRNSVSILPKQARLRLPLCSTRDIVDHVGASCGPP
jgi:hypothetical protein